MNYKKAYNSIARQLDSCVFTCINPELAGKSATAIRYLAERLDDAEYCIYTIEDALDRGSDNDWARGAILEYENRR